MKKLLILFMAYFAFSACSDDDDENRLSYETLMGTWNVTEYATSGDYQVAPKGEIFMTFINGRNYKVKFHDDVYIGSYMITDNIVAGTTLNDITEKFEFVSLENDIAEIHYSNSKGDEYKFKAVKKNNSELDNTEWICKDEDAIYTLKFHKGDFSMSYDDGETKEKANGVYLYEPPFVYLTSDDGEMEILKMDGTRLVTEDYIFIKK